MHSLSEHRTCQGRVEQEDEYLSTVMVSSPALDSRFAGFC